VGLSAVAASLSDEEDALEEMCSATTLAYKLGLFS
jgi:hypothetical protein